MEEALTLQDLEELAKELEASKGNYPDPAPRDSLLTLFREIIKLDHWFQVSKVGFLNDKELGRPRIPVRTMLMLADFAETENLDLVARYLRDKSKIVTATSLSRKAKLLEMPFTVKRETRTMGPPKETVKKSLFGGETRTVEGVEE